ncbi:MAG TPA: hypothetical protein VFS32_14115, partial [Candidatus Limnocylindrales bacterium]|nr:hypothetical protein [Candidatus Limnocylindrales bacterium]
FVLRDALRREASSVGAVFIDPIAGGWLAGSSIRYIGPDGLHPTNAGHRHLAQLVLDGLRTPKHERPSQSKRSTPPLPTPTQRPTIADPCDPRAGP